MTGTPTWAAGLADVFTLNEVLARAGAGAEDDAVSWLYAAVERGRVLPVGGDGNGGPIRYRFATNDRFAHDAARSGDELTPSG